MNIREPAHYDGIRAERQTKHRRRSLKKRSLILIVVLVLLVGMAGGAYLRPLPKATAKTNPPIVTTQAVALAWPGQGQAAVGALGQGVLDATADQKPLPMASVAKTMLALAVLKKYPLAVGQTGPMVPITAADVALYEKYIRIDGSVVRVAVGEQISEYQALQAVMLPSANNVADSLAIWAYGSMEQYFVAANQLAQSLGMSQTTFAGDASGFLPASTTTARDLILLGQAALTDPVLKGIVAQKTAELPLVGTVSNVNFLLGQNNIIGIKTGNTDEAGGCYLTAATHTFANGKTVTVVAAVLGASSLASAMSSSVRLLDSTYKGFGDIEAVKQAQLVGQYNAAWGASASITTAQSASVFGWKAGKISYKIDAPEIKSETDSKAKVGRLTATTPFDSQTIDLVISSKLAPPAASWRVIRH